MDLSAAFQYGLEKVTYMQEELQGKFPHITKDAKWLTNTNGHWTGGFWTGLLWFKVLYEGKNNKEQTKKALEQAKKLAVRINDNKTHDMGFIFGPSCIFGNHIEPDSQLVDMAKSGAHNMEDLYEEKVGLVLAWDEPGYEGTAIVDTIMNAPIMVWTAHQENNQSLYSKAITLADSIMKNHIRDDHSIYHVVKWDTETFEIAERSTHQGYSEDTCWSRGQAWALYGFANMFRYTSKEKYLKSSEKLANYYWSHVDDMTYLPRWDFAFKNNKEEPIDAAAASIASSGMLLLAKMFERNNQVEEAGRWRERGEKIIDALIDNCLYQSLDRYGLIEKATVDKPRNSGVNESAMYGDYYFMESIYRSLNFESSERLELLY